MEFFKDKLSALLEQYNWIDEKLLVFWGTGKTTDLYFPELECANIKPLFFMGYDKKQYCGIEVKNPKETLIKNWGKQYNYVIMTTSENTYNQIISDMRGLGINTQRICSVGALYYAHYKKELIEVMDLLEDEKSKESFYELINARINNTMIPYDIIETRNKDFVFWNYRKGVDTTVYIDAGAYVGDTMEEFLKKNNGIFKKYYAFEPSVSNYKAMKKRAERLRKEWNLTKDQIQCLNQALGNSKKFVSIHGNSNLNGSVIENNENDSIKSISLDEFFKNLPYTVTHIKADIEGAEIEMLHGAEQSIKKYCPSLSICIYHKRSDVFNIIKYIRSLSDKYKLYIRCHSEQGNDTVLYAFTEGKEGVN